MAVRSPSWSFMEPIRQIEWREIALPPAPRLCLEPVASNCDQIRIGPGLGWLSIAYPHELLFRRSREIPAELAFVESDILFALMFVTKNEIFSAMADALDYVDRCVIAAVAMLMKLLAHDYIPSYSVLATTSSWMGLPISHQYWVNPATRTTRSRYLSCSFCAARRTFESTMLY